jgi:hypothetical protein
MSHIYIYIYIAKTSTNKRKQGPRQHWIKMSQPLMTHCQLIENSDEVCHSNPSSYPLMAP